MHNSFAALISKVKTYRPNLRKVSVHVSILTGALLCVGLLFSALSTSEKERFSKFLDQCGVRGLAETRIVHVQSSFALNSDYQERIFFAVIQIERQNFGRFLMNNVFSTNSPFMLPVKGSSDLTIPSWWKIEPTNDQVPRYNKAIGGKDVKVFWADGYMYIYGFG